MDYQEAIEILSNQERYVGIKYVNGVEEAYVTPYFEKALSAAISAMQELQEYRKLGTMEEVREAMERQQEKKATDIRGDKLKFCTCPLCGKRISNVEGGNYCQNCGQKLDWSEEE